MFESLIKLSIVIACAQAGAQEPNSISIPSVATPVITSAGKAIAGGLVLNANVPAMIGLAIFEGTMQPAMQELSMELTKKLTIKKAPPKKCLNY